MSTASSDAAATTDVGLKREKKQNLTNFWDSPTVVMLGLDLLSSKATESGFPTANTLYDSFLKLPDVRTLANGREVKVSSFADFIKRLKDAADEYCSADFSIAHHKRTPIPGENPEDVELTRLRKVQFGVLRNLCGKNPPPAELCGKLLRVAQVKERFQETAKLYDAKRQKREAILGEIDCQMESAANAIGPNQDTPELQRAPDDVLEHVVRAKINPSAGKSSRLESGNNRLGNIPDFEQLLAHPPDSSAAAHRAMTDGLHAEISKAVQAEISKVILPEIGKVVQCEISKVAHAEISKVVQAQMTKVLQLIHLVAGQQPLAPQQPQEPTRASETPRSPSKTTTPKAGPPTFIGEQHFHGTVQVGTVSYAVGSSSSKSQDAQFRAPAAPVAFDLTESTPPLNRREDRSQYSAIMQRYSKEQAHALESGDYDRAKAINKRMYELMKDKEEDIM